MKIIDYNVELKSTRINRSYSTPEVYTNDLNSVVFQFEILDMTAEELTGATATTLLYMRDGSFFQNSATDVTLNGNVFSYTLKENEGNHSGLAQIQLIVKLGTKEYASQLFNFKISNGLGDKVAVEVMVQDWTTLLREARAYIAQFLLDEDGRQATFVASEQDRQLAFEEAEALRQQKETERKDAEDGRIANETVRVASENSRESAEDNRKQNELTRESAESVRVSNEAERISKDSERDSKIEAVVNGKADKVQEDWITPTLLNGWTEGGAGVKYTKNEFGEVRVDLSAVPGTGDIFVLPVGYRPNKTMDFPCQSGSGFGAIRINKFGSVQRSIGTGAYVLAHGITFRAEE